MASKEDVQKLASLARIAIPEEDTERFAKEFEGILAYVGTLDELTLATGKPEIPAVRNVLRNDGEPHAPGAYTEKLVEQFPDKEGNHLKVKQIISYD